VDDPLDLAGRVVLVTGGTRGIGHGIATRFAHAGATVVVCGRSEPTAEDVVGTFVAADVRDPEAVDTLISAVVEEHGCLDVVVNNAGGSPHGAVSDVSPRFLAAIIDLNLTAALYVAQRANAVMQQQDDGGCIVNIGSLSGLRASPGTAAYGAAKAGLLNLTRSLAMEWAPKVRVNAVSAGYVATEQSAEHYGGEDGVARVAATVPMGRMGTPRDVADACLYLASPMAAYVTGANVEVHGGGEPPPFLAAARGE
jgi:NAD(P)-dependent dehydrogenase (short-subunit alcohol dehydrogenase family)